MAKQSGRELLVKIGDGEASEAFVTLCGLNSKTLSLNNNTFDVTTADCAAPGGPLWAETMTGIKSMTVSGSGYFDDSASETRALTVTMSATAKANFQIEVPDLGTFSGSYVITSLEYGGEVEDGVTYGVSMQSDGAIAFAAA